MVPAPPARNGGTGSVGGRDEALDRDGHRDRLPAIRVPTLILADADGVGYDSPSPDSARSMAVAIPSSRLIMYSAGDWWFLPSKTVLAEVDRFLADLDSHDPVLDRVFATVLFTDIVDPTDHAIELGDRRWRDVLEQHHAITREQLRRWRGKELDVAREGFFSSFDGPAGAVRCAVEITKEVGGLGIEIRAGLHTGECEVLDGKIGGIAVHLDARIAAQSSAGEVLVSSTVRDLVAGSGLQFEDAGQRDIKGFSEEWHLYRVIH